MLMFCLFHLFIAMLHFDDSLYQSLLSSRSLPVSLLLLCHSLCGADGTGWVVIQSRGWLQQSPAADWFYNPHSGSQMGENQLAGSAALKAVILMHTHMYSKAHTLPFSISHFSGSHHCFHYLQSVRSVFL